MTPAAAEPRTEIHRSTEAPRPATLLIIERGNHIRMVPITGTMRVGQNLPGVEAEILLNSAITSKKHGVFFHAGDSFYYRDNGSLNGTFYNGTRIPAARSEPSRPVRLLDGDVLRIDRSTLNDPHPDAVEMVFSTRLRPDDQWYRGEFGNNTVVAVGRNIKNGISLPDFMVSRQHASFQKKDNQWYIVDHHSMNGIAVNKRAVIGAAPLSPFDVIRIGNTMMIFLGNSVIFNVAKEQLNPAAGHTKRIVMNVNIQEVRVPKSGGIGKVTLLRDINLDIDSGDFILILGGSGAGKTTFLRALLGVKDYETTGRILFDGLDLKENFSMLKHKLGIVEQFPTTRDNDTVYHTIHDQAISTLSGEYSRKEIQERVDKVMKQMMLESLRNHLLRNLSGGQRKRLEVAVQAIGDQEVFILDEPDSGMDYATRKDLMENLKSCTRSGGVVSVITHAPDDAAELFTKVIVLAKSQSDHVGHLAFYGSVQEALRFFGVSRLSEIVMEINYEGGKGRGDEFIQKFARERSM